MAETKCNWHKNVKKINLFFFFNAACRPAKNFPQNTKYCNNKGMLA